MAKNPYDKITEADNYWDIDDMLPRRKDKLKFSSDTETVEIHVSDVSGKDKGEKIPDAVEEKLRIAREAIRKAQDKISRSAAMRAHIDISFDDGEAEAQNNEIIDEYAPLGNPLIERVKILPWPARYSFYERFRSDAIRLFGKEGKECEYVSFFSYTPQYIQLSKEQLGYYLWWRGKVRNGEYPDTDYSYILLFIYEIINLPDLVSAEDGVRLLCGIWRAYREKYMKLDRLLSEWVCDYCLIGKVSPPDDVYASYIDAIMASASLKEFYVGYDSSTDSPYGSALFAYGSNYNYRKSKFITQDNRTLFDTHIKSSFLYAFEKAEQENGSGLIPSGRRSMVKVSVTRDAFSGALCAYDIKRRISVDYLSCSRSVELRYIVTDCIKYAENNVRSMLGIRSRFHTTNLPVTLRKAIDEYFEPYKVKAKKERSSYEEPEYEKQYEPRQKELSIDFAKEIEERSWAVTGLLTEEDTGVETDCSLPDDDKTNERGLNEAEYANPVEEEYVRQALSVLLDGEQQHFRAIAASNNLLPDALADKINEVMFDVLGDAAVEQDGSSYRVIEDYREDVIQWMKK